MILNLIIKFIIVLLMLTNILLLIFKYSICDILQIACKIQLIIRNVMRFVGFIRLKRLKFRFYSHNLISIRYIFGITKLLRLKSEFEGNLLYEKIRTNHYSEFCGNFRGNLLRRTHKPNPSLCVSLFLISGYSESYRNG